MYLFCSLRPRSDSSQCSYVCNEKRPAGSSLSDPDQTHRCDHCGLCATQTARALDQNLGSYKCDLYQVSVTDYIVLALKLLTRRVTLYYDVLCLTHQRKYDQHYKILFLTKFINRGCVNSEYRI